MSKVKTNYVGNGEVVLIAGGGRVYTDIAARFVRSERPLTEIIESPYSPEIVRNIINSGHLAATEFDLFIFGVSGYSRVCEIQLVRKRLASYLIKSGRAELNGKRAYEVTYPETINSAVVDFWLPLPGVHDGRGAPESVKVELTPKLLNQLICAWYDGALATGKYKEEDLRYMKPQATSWKGIIGMNAHALRDWLKIRMCRNAQREIRHMACQMYRLAKDAAPDLMEGAGPSCVSLGYCPEGKYQNSACKASVFTKETVFKILEEKKLQLAACDDYQDVSDDLK